MPRIYGRALNADLPGDKPLECAFPFYRLLLGHESRRARPKSAPW